MKKEFDPCAYYHGGNAESVDAHKTIARCKTAYHTIILSYLRHQKYTGATVDEMVQAIGGLHQNISARATELKAKGLIVDCGERRLTRSGRKAAVLVLKEFEHDFRDFSGY